MANPPQTHIQSCGCVFVLGYPFKANQNTGVPQKIDEPTPPSFNTKNAETWQSSGRSASSSTSPGSIHRAGLNYPSSSSALAHVLAGPPVLQRPRPEAKLAASEMHMKRCMVQIEVRVSICKTVSQLNETLRNTKSDLQVAEVFKQFEIKALSRSTLSNEHSQRFLKLK